MTASPLSVAYILRAFPRLSETFILGELVALRRCGVEVRVVALERTAESCMHPEAARLLPEVEFAVADPGSAVRAPSGVPERHRRHWDAGERIASHIRSAGVRHVHAHFAGPAATAAAAAAAAAGMSFSFTAHAKDIFADGADWRWIRELGRRADRVITVCEYNRRFLRGRMPQARVARVYNGVDLRAWRPAVAAPRSLHVVAVGRLVPKKGFHVLIDAMAALRDQGLAATATLIGDGVERPRLEEQVRSLGLGRHVRLAGALAGPAVRRIVRRAQVAVLPCVVAADGNQDALPTVLLEAGACGVPVVATRVAGIPEIVGHGITGLLVPPGDATALARALARLLRSPERCARMGREARRRIERRFDRREAATSLIRVFETCARDRARHATGESHACRIAVP